MADLLTHYAVGRIVAIPLARPMDKAAVAIGAALPDILAKPILHALPLPEECAIPAHSLSGMLLACAFAALVLPEPRRAIVWTFVGALTHLAVDLLKSDLLADHGSLLFPFSDALSILPLYRSLDTIYIAPIALVGVLLIDALDPLRPRR